MVTNRVVWFPRSSMQERRKVLDTPGIVDHQFIERVGQRELGGVEGVEPGPPLRISTRSAMRPTRSSGFSPSVTAERNAAGDSTSMLDAANRCLDLTPPILTALEIVEIAVALEGATSGLKQRLQASSALEAIRARV
jgi:hypothetical protein